MTRAAVLVATFLVASIVSAQQLYRWTDDQGRVHVTDTPPPPSAKDVQKKKPRTNVVETVQPSFELNQAMKDYPVRLYTSPMCKEPCARARDALSKRGVPFKEIQVWDVESNEELKRVSGSSQVPTLVVGSSVQMGFEQGAFDALLDSARYPKAGVLSPRVQAAPRQPEGYVSPAEGEAVKAQPVKPAEETPRGPYSPGAAPQRSQKK